MILLSIASTHSAIIADISRDFLSILKWGILIFGAITLTVCIISMIVVMSAAIIDEFINYKNDK